MGYICPSCGEGLPEDTPCPCTMGPDDEDEEKGQAGRPIRTGWHALTRELDDTSSPVRLFLGQFTPGLRDLQRRYRQSAPPLAIPAVPLAEANPGTLGGAADWLLRFLVSSRPSLHLAALGTTLFGNMRSALEELAGMLGMTDLDLNRSSATFTGPALGTDADPDLLARACWALALMTEIYRAGPAAAMAGPLAPYTGRFAALPSAAELLELTPHTALSQLTDFRRVFETALLPALAGRRGAWALGPTFQGSTLMNADGDLIAAGLLLDLKTSKKLTLGVKDVLQVIGYALLDFDDEFGIKEAGIFAARYAYLATWDLASLLSELALHEVSVQAARQEFRQLLLTAVG